MNLLAVGKKILDRLPDAQYQKLNKLCDLIKFNYACRIKDESELNDKICQIIQKTTALTMNNTLVIDPIGAEEIIKLCKEYHKK